MTIYNFSAGPALLPQDVLREAQRELTDWHGSGMSVMEMSHRGREFMSIHAQAEADLRELLQIPDNYRVLFLQGGAHSQFSMVPMNLLRGKTTADYVITGHWGKVAIKEARRYGDMRIAATGEASGFNGTTSATKPSAACSFRSFPNPVYRWSVTCRAISCRDRLTFPASD